MANTCNICGCDLAEIFRDKVLYKYNVQYLKCQACGFIQTEKPFWLQEAYTTPITNSDIGLIQRNIHFSDVIPGILDICSTENDSYLDYGGGYGMFVRMMRDKGYDFYLQDVYTQNLFAKNFELKDYRKEGKFKVLTAFEVFEHLEKPVEEIKIMSKFSDILIFSTEFQPNCPLTTSSDWWYFSSNTGQHISFYTLKALNVLAETFNYFLYSNEANLHILSKEALREDPFSSKKKSNSRLVKLVSKLWMNDKKAGLSIRRSSLLQTDFESIKKEEMSIYSSL